MFKASTSLGLAALMVWVTAILHMATPVVADFSKETFWLVPTALIFAVFGYLMLPNRRWMAWLTFFFMLGGAITAIGFSVGGGTIPDWWWKLILSADVAAAALLFIYLWNPKPVVTT